MTSSVAIKSAKEADLMRESGKLLASVFEMLDTYVRPGLSTMEINDTVERFITEQLHARPASKGQYDYQFVLNSSLNDVVCHGIPKNSTSLVKINIKDKKTQKNLDSITKYKLLIKKNNISLIFFKPYTGRMHQLRLVAKHLNCPIVGDAKYSFNNKYFKEKLQLNAIYLNFIFKNKEYEFYSKIPAYMKNFLKKNQIKIEEKEIYDKILISF